MQETTDLQSPLKPDKATKMRLTNMLNTPLNYLAASQQIPCKIEEMIGNWGHKKKAEPRTGLKR